MIDLEGDFSGVISAADFTVSADITPTGGATYTVNGIFTEKRPWADPEFDHGNDDQEAEIQCSSSVITAATKREAKVLINGVSYRAEGVVSDGEGVTFLKLVRVTKLRV